MRIAVIADICIDPVASGNARRIRSLVESLQGLGADVHFIGLGLGPPEQARMQAILPGRCYFTRHAHEGFAHPRYYNLDKWLRVKLAVRGLAPPGVDIFYLRQWDQDLRQIAARETFDAVIVEYVFFSQALRCFPQVRLKVIDAHDVFTDRDKVLARRGIKNTYRYLRLGQEITGLSRADAVLAIQARDAAFFRQHLPTRVQVVESGTVYPPCPRPAGRQPEPLTVAFVATDYLPNIDGLRWYVEAVLPLLRKLVPGVRTLVYGSVCKKLADSFPVERRGFVADVAEAYHAAVCAINPVLTGTGLKTKTIETLAHGIPLISTPVGSEGLESADGHGLVVAETAERFAEGLARALTDPVWLAQMERAALTTTEEWNQLQTGRLISLLEQADIRSQPQSNLNYATA